MILNDKFYRALKWNVLVFLPALTSFVGVIGREFGWEFLPSILSIMTGLTSFLGALIGISSVNYHNSNEDYKGGLSNGE